MSVTRIEEDLLGLKEVPIGAYYGIHTAPAMEGFKISSAKISDVPEMVRASPENLIRLEFRGKVLAAQTDSAVSGVTS